MLKASDDEEPKGRTSTVVRILIVDDSAVMRAILERMLDGHPAIQIIDKVATALQAFDVLKKERADIVLLDHEMPGLKGLEALPEMIRLASGGHVVMLSSFCAQGSELAVRALQLGASYVVQKPTWEQATPDFAEALIRRFLHMALDRSRQDPDQLPAKLRNFPSDFHLRCIGIGASTGGIHALTALLDPPRRKPGVPILITQHLPDAFIPYYARQVAAMTRLPVLVAEQDALILPDHIYISPGDRSLSCRRSGGDVRVHLVEERDPASGARPSVNMMFAGLADCYGAGAFGVVLTGIGRDGTTGARQIVEAGGGVIAQDRDSSTVWGMPGSVTRAGLVCATLRPEQMAAYLYRHLGYTLC